LPWLERIPIILCNVVPLKTESGDWLARDVCGQALPLERFQHWTLLAYSGGQPLDLIAEWNGDALTPLGVFIANEWHPLPEND
jgi:hypothetical protein